MGAVASAKLRTALSRQAWSRTAFALALALPLFLFLLATFLVPIATLLVRAVDNPEVAHELELKPLK